MLPTPVRKFDDTLVDVRKCNGVDIPLLPIPAIWTSGDGSKKADVGCPVNYIRPEDGNWTVIGVFSCVSYGYPDCVEKDSYFPYNRIQSSLNWIYNITGLPNPDADVVCPDPLTTTPTTFSTTPNSSGQLHAQIAFMSMFLTVLCVILS